MPCFLSFCVTCDFAKSLPLTVLPKASNMSVKRPLDCAVHVQGLKRTKEHVKYSISVQSVKPRLCAESSVCSSNILRSSADTLS